MALYSYIAGSARVPNTVTTEYRLEPGGAPNTFATIAAFIANAPDRDLSVNPAPTLIIPTGTNHVEDIAAPLNMTGWSNPSATNRPLIIGEDPSNPPSVHLRSSQADAALMSGLYLTESYTELWDFKLSMTFSAAVSSGHMTAAAVFGNTQKLVGMVLEDLIAENALAGSYIGGFVPGASGILINCGVNALKSVSVGSGIPIAFSGLFGGNKYYNCTATSTQFALGAAFAGTATDEMINCIAQDAGMNVAGGVVETTSRVGQAITMSADGYHVPDNTEVTAGSITDVSALFTDDIDGQEIVAPIVGADYVPAAPANTAPTVDTVSPATGSTVSSRTSLTITAKYHDADADVGSLILKDNLGNTLDTDSGLNDGDTGTLTATVVPGNSYTFTITPNDGTEDGTPVEITVTINAGPTVADISPANNAIADYATSVTLSATYNDADGGTGSLIFAESDGTVIGTASGVAAGASGSVPWSGLSDGRHTFKVRAYDGTDYSAWSSLITFTIAKGILIPAELISAELIPAAMTPAELKRR